MINENEVNFRSWICFWLITFTRPKTWKEAIILFFIIYRKPLHGDYIEMFFFLWLVSGSPFENFKLWISWFCGFIISLYGLQLKSFQVQSVTCTKTTKITRSSSQNKNKAHLVSNLIHEIKQTRTKTCHVQNKNITRCYYKEKTKQNKVMTRNIPKTCVE